MTTEKKKQKVSESYTITAFSNNVEKLSTLNLLSVEDYEELKEIKKRIVEKYTNKLLGN